MHQDEDEEQDNGIINPKREISFQDNKKKYQKQFFQ
jgi:hypothetical protein